MHEIRAFNENCYFFFETENIIYIKKMRLVCIKKNLSLLFKGKVLNVHQGNSQEREVSHIWTA